MKITVWFIVSFSMLMLQGCSPSNVQKDAATSTQPISNDPPTQRENLTPRTNANFNALENSISFRDVGLELGILHVYENGEKGGMLFHETFGGGNGWLDYDRDGNWDCYLNQGGDATASPDLNPLDALYRNCGDSFRNVAENAGIRETGYGQGVAIADFDSDGFDDIYVTNLGANTLWHNLGDGTFAEIAEMAGVADSQWSTSAAWGDLDNDGDLDLYVCNYTIFDPKAPHVCRNAKGELIVCNPKNFEPAPDSCFINLGNGQFIEEAKSRGLHGTNNRALGVAIADFNQDGFADVYVANDATENFLFINQGNGRFDDQAQLLGCAVDRRGSPQASMGLGINDFDQNGWIDIYSTHFWGESNTLYANYGKTGFQDVTGTVGLHEPTLDFLGFGTAMQDFDASGTMEIFVSNGHVDNSGTNPNQKMSPQLFTYRNKRFEELTKNSGEYFVERWIGRGVSWCDFDRDGMLDLLVTHQNQRAALLRNESREGNWIEVSPIGRHSNRSGIGCKMTVSWPTGKIFSELVGGGSYCSAMPKTIYIGLPPQVDRLDIRLRWPSGADQLFKNVIPRQFLVLTEDGM